MKKFPAACAAIGAVALLAGCTQSADRLGEGLSSATTSVKSMVTPGHASAYRANERDRECLARAMFFESNRSSRDGLVAVGSVVMNRLESRKWGDNICGVVGAKRQFAPGVMSRPMNSKAMPDVMAAADSVLKGERHPKVQKEVMFFHTAGLKFPYKNMHYTTVAGGNAFYEKRDRRRMRNEQQAPAELPTVMVASNEQPTGLAASNEQAATLVASNDQPVLPETVTLAANEPVSRDKTGRAVKTAPPPGVTGLPEPEAGRFGGEAKTMTAEMKPVFDTAETAMSYEASPEQASAIGALLLAQQTE